MEQLTLEQIAAFCGAEIQENYSDIFINGISRDNRYVNPGDLFVAIKGENFDGHSFVEKAAQAGASAALVSRDVPEAGVPLLIVEDTIAALQEIAKGYRNMFNEITVVGITGSVGKTTTKEMCASVLSEGLYTLKTQGNFNNDIGMPFTVMGLNFSHQAAVLEMGANHFGEISRLTNIAAPDIAVITTIGESHIEYFKSKEGVRRAKLEILEGLKPDGTLVLCGDDPMLWQLRGTLGVKTVYCGVDNPECDVLGKVISENSEEIVFSVRGISGIEFSINCAGRHNLKNALLAVAVGQAAGRSSEEIKKGLENFVNTGSRQKILKIRGATIISDCYNASPDSMRAALNVLGDFKCNGRKIAALGDMLELGDHSQTAHFGIGEFASARADIILAAGNWAQSVATGAENHGFPCDKILCFKDATELAEYIKAEISANDVLLVKGSHGMHMEIIIEELEKNAE